MGIEIKKIREDLGLSQAAFADQLGVHQSTVCRWEQRPGEIDRRTLLAIAALQTAARRALEKESAA